MNKKIISLHHGGGGTEQEELIKEISRSLYRGNIWKHLHDDGASLKIGKEELVFTTDSYTVNPIFFPGGDIGKLAIFGTLNDLSVMGAKPIGLSLSFIIQDGFPKKDLEKILASIKKTSFREKIPIVTGDTKVVEHDALDKIIINTSGIGISKKVISNKNLKHDDEILISGPLGDHGASLLAKRFDYQTNLKSDCQNIYPIISKVFNRINSAKDPTRGGVATILWEMSQKSKKTIIISEKDIPIKNSTQSICNILGIDPFSLASEGIFICSVSPNNKEKVLNHLKKNNRHAATIGKVKKDKEPQVLIDTGLSLRPIEKPSGILVPRIC